MPIIPPGNYMIELAYPVWKGWFVSVDESHGNSVELLEKDSNKMQVWKLVDMGNDLWSFQGVSPKVDGEKVIGADDKESFYLFYDDTSTWNEFKLESVTGSQDTFRVYLKFGATMLYWCSQGGPGAIRLWSDSTPDDIEWKFTKM